MLYIYNISYKLYIYNLVMKVLAEHDNWNYNLSQNSFVRNRLVGKNCMRMI